MLERHKPTYTIYRQYHDADPEVLTTTKSESAAKRLVKSYPHYLGTAVCMTKGEPPTHQRRTQLINPWGRHDKNA